MHQKLLDSPMAFETVHIQQAEENEIRLCVDVKVVTILKTEEAVDCHDGQECVTIVLAIN